MAMLAERECEAGMAKYSDLRTTDRGRGGEKGRETRAASPEYQALKSEVLAGTTEPGAA